MEHLIVTVHPFLMKQEIRVYKDNQQIDSTECSLENLANICYNFCKKYDIHQIDFSGNKDFGLKIEEKFACDYNDFEIKIIYH